MRRRRLRRRSAAARFLGLRVRIPLEGGQGCLSVVSVVCCTVRGLCDGADPWYRGVIETVVRLSMTVKPRKGRHDPEAGRSVAGEKKDIVLVT